MGLTTFHELSSLQNGATHLILKTLNLLNLQDVGVVYPHVFCYHKPTMTEKKADYIPPQTNLDEDRLIAAIGYLGILCLVPLLLKKNSAFAQHHGKQGLVLLLAWVVLWIGNIIPVLGQIVWFLGSIALLVLVILGMVNALQGKMWEMPFFGSFAKQLKL